MNASFQVLRIKRKRDGHLPLDAFVLDERAGKRRRSAQGAGAGAGAAIFRFAETVPLDSFDTANKTRLVGDRIAAAIAQPAPPPPPLPSSRQSRPLPAPSQYRVVDSSTSDAPIRGPSRRNPLPPIVSAATQPPPTPRDPFTIYDAVLDLPDAPPLPGRPARILPPLAADTDELMNNFVPMLQEYLTLQQSAPRLPETEPMQQEALVSDVDDEVYDVYYRDLRPVAGATDVATLAGLQRVGALAGIVDDDLLSSELLSEDEDEADQDSNEENDYRNDYPSGDEDSDNDSFRNGGSDDEE